MSRFKYSTLHSPNDTSLTLLVRNICENIFIEFNTGKYDPVKAMPGSLLSCIVETKMIINDLNISESHPAINMWKENIKFTATSIPKNMLFKELCASVSYNHQDTLISNRLNASASNFISVDPYIEKLLHNADLPDIAGAFRFACEYGTHLHSDHNGLWRVQCVKCGEITTSDEFHVLDINEVKCNCNTIEYQELQDKYSDIVHSTMVRLGFVLSPDLFILATSSLYEKFCQSHSTLVYRSKVGGMSTCNPDGFMALLVSVCTCGTELTCQVWNRSRLLSVTKVIPSLLISIFVVGRMCRFGECCCSNEDYGLLLQEVKIIMCSKYQKKYGQYGKTKRAISHCWGDRLLLGTDTEFNAIEQTLQKHSMLTTECWLDLAQVEKFDAIKCRREYSGDVIVINRTGFKLDRKYPKNLIVDILALSDWAERGWVAQEVSTAKRLLLLTPHECIKLNIKDTEQYATLFGCIDFSIKSSYSTLVTRVWRYKLDIVRTSEWWSSKPQQDILKYMEQNALTNGNANCTATQACWIPTSLEAYDMKYKLWETKVLDNGKKLLIQGKMAVVLCSEALQWDYWDGMTKTDKLAINSHASYSSYILFLPYKENRFGKTKYNSIGVSINADQASMHVQCALTIRMSEDSTKKIITYVKKQKYVIGLLPNWLQPHVKIND